MLYCSIVVLILLLVYCALGNADRQKRSWYFGPHYSFKHYYSGSYGPPRYDQDPGYRSQPSCSYRRSCYDYALVLSGDGYLNHTADGPRFRTHYREAGFDKKDMIAEGRKAAVYFYHQFGISAIGLSGQAYLAPDIKFPGDVKFQFRVAAPPRPIRLTMASKKDYTQFYNFPVRIAYWEMKFEKPYRSSGQYKGVIPAGGTAKYGSFLIDTCPYQRGYQRCDSILSSAPKGRVLIRFWSRGVNWEIADYIVEHDHWGLGTGRGVFTQDTADVQNVHVRLVLTFPETCDIKAGCYPKGRRRRNKHYKKHKNNIR